MGGQHARTTEVFEIQPAFCASSSCLPVLLIFCELFCLIFHFLFAERVQCTSVALMWRIAQSHCGWSTQRWRWNIDRWTTPGMCGTVPSPFFQEPISCGRDYFSFSLHLRQKLSPQSDGDHCCGRYKYAYMEEMLGNVASCRQIFERWMEWEPDEQAWHSYINFELRYKEVDRARKIYEKYILWCMN